MIPKIIHTMWIDKHDYDNSRAPKKYRAYPAYDMSWQVNHPKSRGWEFTFWNRRRIEKLWEQPELSKWRYLYYQISQIIMKCDLSRYAVLYFYGGIYHDLDYICYQPFDSLIANRDILLCREPVETTEGLLYREQAPVGNCILGSAARHPFWVFLLDEICAGYSESKDVLNNTGPDMLTKCVNKYNKLHGGIITVLPSTMLLPFHTDELTREYAQDLPTYGSSISSEGSGWQSEGFYNKIKWQIFIAVLLLIVIIFFMIQYGRKSKVCPRESE